jgi:hypothetical protein
MATVSTSEPRKRGPGRPFQKGQTGNPGGRSKELADIRALIRDSLPKAVAYLLALVDDDNARPEIRLEAVKTLLAYGVAKPAPSPSNESSQALQAIADALCK